MELTGRRLVTTDWVLTELLSYCASPPQRRIALKTVDLLRDSAVVEVVPASRESFDDGVSLFRKRSDKAWSLVDCISIRVAQRLKIREVFTADRHFTQAGFRILLRA